MKNYIIYCKDKPDSAEPREKYKQGHFAHIEANIDRYQVGGPTRNEAGESVGSMIIIKAESAQDARTFIEKDPYFAADFWAEISIHEYVAAVGDWVGGKTW